METDESHRTVAYKQAALNTIAYLMKVRYLFAFFHMNSAHVL